MKFKKSCGVLVAVAGLLCAAPAFCDEIIGYATIHSNCIPFGCGHDYPGEYQQVYNANAFSGPITITALGFFNTVTHSSTSQLNHGAWTIALSTTTADWNTLSSTFASNIGADNTSVFSGDLGQPWAFGDTLTIPLSTPFTYNPASGNLLMDVMVSGVTDLSRVYFDAELGSTIMSRAITLDFGSTFTVSQGYGLVTGFVTVPEPATLALFGIGLAGLGFSRRRKRA